jgi:putative tricarboxylic transport membrane protein
MSAARKADPNTLVLINGSTQITPIITPTAKTVSEVQPIMNVMLDDFVFFVRADAPWKSAAEFVKDAKSKPAKTYNFSTGGTTDVMAVTVLSKATGTQLNMINFNSGGEALTALLGGHVHATLGNPLEFMGHLQKGAVRAIGVFRDDRFALLPNVANMMSVRGETIGKVDAKPALLPNVPPIKEKGLNAPNFRMWRDVAVPKAVPADAAKYWEGVMAKVVATPQFKAYLKDNAAAEAPIAGPAFEKFLAGQERLYRDLLGK